MTMAMEEEVVVPKPLMLYFHEENKRCVNYAYRYSWNVSSEKKLVCVTSGNSQLGSHIVRALLSRGYLVRVTINNQEDFEDMNKLMTEEEIDRLESVVVAKMGSLDMLCDAFWGCHAIFHTSSFIDPHGVAGYSGQMAFLETEGAKNVIEACARAAYMKRCIFTSSLLACVWSGDSENKVIDESSWSNVEFCRENKLWLALGKTNAEMASCRKSKEMNVNLVTVCPGLLMDSGSHHDSSIPYLKGGKDMLKKGLLAIEDVKKAAEAHVYVYEAMDNEASGRYLCFGKVVSTRSEAIELENTLKAQGLLSGLGRGSNEVLDEEINSMLSNTKLVRLTEASKRLSCKLEV